MQVIFGATRSSFRTKRELALENLALRHQIGVQLRSKSCSRFAVTAGSFHTLRATGAMKGLEPKVAKSIAWQCMRSVAGRAIVRRRIRDQGVAGSNPVSPTKKAAIPLGKPTVAAFVVSRYVSPLQSFCSGGRLWTACAPSLPSDGRPEDT